MGKAELNWLSVSVTALLLSACTAEQAYKDLQENHRRQCLQLPVWQQSHCLSRQDTSWEDYTRERNAASGHATE